LGDGIKKPGFFYQTCLDGEDGLTGKLTGGCYSLCFLMAVVQDFEAQVIDRVFLIAIASILAQI